MTALGRLPPFVTVRDFPPWPTCYPVVSDHFWPQTVIPNIHLEELERALMSNETLIARIESGLNGMRAREISAAAFAKIVRNNGRALEAMPYDLIRKIEDLAQNLEIAEWYEKDGFLPDLESVLLRTQAWLASLPRDV
jgi:hypothetical protein